MGLVQGRRERKRDVNGFSRAGWNRGGIAVGKADVCVRHTFDDAVDGQFGDSDQVIVSCWYLLKPSRVLDRGCC